MDEPGYLRSAFVIVWDEFQTRQAKCEDSKAGGSLSPEVPAESVRLRLRGFSRRDRRSLFWITTPVPARRSVSTFLESWGPFLLMWPITSRWSKALRRL